MVRVEMQTAARNGFNRFAHDHSVEIDQVARRRGRARASLCLAGMSSVTGAGVIAVLHDSSGLQRLEGDKDVIAWIELQGRCRSCVPRMRGGLGK